MHVRLAAAFLVSIACSEPEVVAPPPAPEPEAPVAVDADPPALGSLPSAERGHVQMAWPTLESGWAFPIKDVGATFGRDETMVIAQLGEEQQPRIQLTWMGALETGSHDATRELEEGAFSVSFHESPMRVEEGTVQVLAIDDEHFAGTLDLVVHHPLHGDSTHLRANFDAERHTFHDAAIAHQRAIRERLRRP